MRIKLTVAYDGTDFRGWAAQRGQRTVRATVEGAIELVSGQAGEAIGASRTDSGAHAKGQVCHFDTDVAIDPTKWPRILNRVLPGDVAVIASELVDESFHARFSAEDRYYRYRIRQASRDPFSGRYAHEFGRPLDLSKMEQAALLAVGTHDFRAFTEELDPSVTNTTRTLHRVEVTRGEGDEVWIDIVGTAFLRGMMRRISGALLEVGRGHRSIEGFGVLLTDVRDQVQWPVVLPAKGLCLMRVSYANPPRDHRLPGVVP